MAGEIDMQDDELLDLMAQLEAETGVAPTPVAAPVAATPAAVVAPVEAAAPVAAALSQAVIPAAKDDDAELLAALSELDDGGATLTAAAPATTTMLDDIKATDEAAPVTVVAATAPVVAQTAPTVESDPVDELAALEAQIASEALASPAVERRVQVGESAPAVKPSEPLTAALAAIAEVPPPAAAPSGAAALQAHYKTLDFFVDPNQFKIETRVSDVELDRNMIEQNSLRAYYGAQAAQADAQAARMKLRFDIAEAKLYDEHRRILLESGEKITEKMVEVEVKKDKRWATLKGMVIDADTISGINRALVDSLRDRQSMLIQLSADRRDEFKGQRSTMAVTEAHQSEAQRAADAAKRAFNK